MVLAVGELLHKTIDEVLTLSYDEFLLWVSWIEYKNELEEKSIKNTKNNSTTIKRL